MTSYWNTYKSIVNNNCISSEHPRSSVGYWKDKLFATAVVYFIPMCLIALIPSIYLSIVFDAFGIIVADIITISTILAVALLPGISIYLRKILFNGSLYFISIVLFYHLGYDGPGMLYLFAVTVFVVLSMDVLYGYIIFTLNAITCVLVAIFINFDFLDSVLLTQYQLDVWIGVSTNLIFLSGTAVLMIPHLFKGLQTSFDEQMILKEKLQHSVATIQQSEQRFKALVQDGFDMITIFNDSAVYEYVSPTVKTVLGISPEDFIDHTAFEYIHPDDHERIRSILRELNRSEQVKVAPYRFRNSKNEWRWIESTFTNMLENPAVGGYVANSQDITDQITYQNRLEESLNEKNTLLAEIHHRVKNNLAIITSMMELQAMKSDKGELRELLRLAQQLIQTIATIHELLYSAESLSYINFGENITYLVRNIEQMYSGGKAIKTNLEVADIPLNISQAIPCALMVNEVITNVYKHAFNGNEEGEMNIKLRETNNIIHIEVHDNGIGLPDNFDDASSSSIGMTLINSLKDQLEGTLAFSNRNGTHFSFSFKKTVVNEDSAPFT